MQLLTLRASSAPRAFLCPGSVRRAELSINEVTEPANAGNAVHEALRPLAEGGTVDWSELPAIANRWNVDAEELRILCAMATKLWAQVKDSFVDALTEVPLSAEVLPGFVLTGHADLLSASGSVARIGDWKSGRKDGDHSHQVRAYAALAFADDPQLEEVTGTILWIRDQEIENYTFDRAAIDAWLATLGKDVVDWDGTYRPGDHCTYCPRSHECAAANALARRDTAIILDEDIAAELATMPAEKIVSLYKKAAYVEKCAERVRAAVKELVEQRGDIVADEGILTLTTEQRRTLDTASAWPVLEDAGFVDDDFAACVEVRISKMEKRVAEKAGRGKGAAAIRALSERLAAAQAVKTNETKKLVVRRKAG